MKRREFLSSSLAAGAGTLLMSNHRAAGEAADPELDVALIGAGIHGRTLLNCLLASGGVRIRAVCDVWPYRRNAAVYYLEAFGQKTVGFEDYRQMLDQVDGLQAVVVATPDFVHAEQTLASLQAGLHVYCEAPMARTFEQARAMAEAAEQTGKLLQVGYQRRSSPRYQLVAENLLGEAELLGDITAAGSQWNQPELWEQGWPQRLTLPAADLQKYGYADMRQFRNWRWFTRYSAGPFVSAAVHQVDVLNRLLGTPPRAVLAAGGADFFDDRQCHDHVTAIFEYPHEARTIRATCQVLTTTRGTAGSHELLVGTEGSLRTSDNPQWFTVFREPTAADWNVWVRQGFLVRPERAASSVPTPDSGGLLHVEETGLVEEYRLPLTADKSSLHYHIENFLQSIRGKARLNCPAETALASEAAVLRALEAVEAKRQLPIRAEDA